MARSAKRSPPSRSSEARPAADRPAREEAPAPHTRLPLRVRALPFAWLLFGAIVMFLGFAGFAVWPLAFVGMLPAMFVVDPLQARGGFERPAGGRLLGRLLFFGYAAELGGFHWLAHTLTTFSGFPYALSLVLASIFFLFQGLQFVLILTLWTRARARGFAATPSLVAAYLASEAVFPMLFEHYYGASLHPVPVLMQIADLGGPMMCTALLMGVNGALYDVAFALASGARPPRLWPALAGGYLVFALGYGTFRMGEVDALARAAPSLRVGTVQTSLGMGELWSDPERNTLEHVELTERLVREADPDLVVWPESAIAYFLPSGLDDLDRWAHARRLGLDRVQVPLVFGGLRHERVGEGRELDRNTAFLTDAERRVIGAYDKTYLLAFGEYLPLGDSFPVLYDISPMSGRFTPGDDPAPLVLPARDGREHRLSVLICYEDIVSAFVRRAVREGDPHLLVNITNDSWFGDTHEPWVHMHLARFRAIEHRRFLVRATSSGVSAIIDAAGRVLASSEIGARQTLHAEVAMLSGSRTLYAFAGPWPGWLALAAILAMCFLPERWLPRRRLPSALGPATPAGAAGRARDDR